MVDKIITSKLEVAFSLEVSGSDLTLINETNKHIYKPDNDLYTNKYIIEQLDKNNNFKFTVTDVFDINSPEIVINDFHKVVFKRELSRSELEEKLDNYGKNQRDINILMKSVTNLEQLIMSKLSSLEKLATNNVASVEADTEIFKQMSLLYQKEIKLILELKFNDLSKIVNNLDKNENSKVSEMETYYCKGINNGCTCQGSIWGDNPYSIDSNDNGVFCKAALHSGVISENGGYYTVKNLGSFDTYISTTKNGVTSLSLGPSNGCSIIFKSEKVQETKPELCKKLNSD